MGKLLTAADIAKKCKTKAFQLPIRTLDDYDSLDIENGTFDTTSAALNCLVSGSPIGGVAIGKVTGFYGPSGCGKSYIAGRTMAVAQGMGYIPVLVDTEHAWNANAESYGLDIGNVLKLDGAVIEDVRNDIVKLIKGLDDALTAGECKLVVIIDSLAGLRCAKEVRDVDDDKDAADMGQRAKAMKSLMTTLRSELGKRNITFLWTNHAIADPSITYKTSIQKMPGGNSIMYESDVVVGMRRNEVKTDTDSEFDNKIVRNQGAEMPIECVKQRFVCPFHKSTMFLSYKEGIKRFHGMFEIGKSYGVITGDRSYELSDGTKLGFRKTFDDDDEIWNTKIIPLLDPVIREEFGFGSKKTKELLESIDDGK